MSGNKSRNRWLLKLEGIYRIFFMVCLAEKKKSLLVTEFPKSGGSWLTSMLAEVLSIDFPQNSFPRKMASAFQGHYLNSYLQKKIVVLWRDPKDIMVSWYFHSVVGNNHSNEAFVRSVREKCGITCPEDVVLNLPKFIRYSFAGEMSPGFNWNDFYDKWHADSNAVHISYEELRNNPVDALSRLIVELGFELDDNKIKCVVEKFSFKNVSGRSEGQEDNKSFARKGVVGDWVNYFSDEALLVFNEAVADRAIFFEKINNEG